MNKDLLLWVMIISIMMRALGKILGGLTNHEPSTKMNAVDAFAGFGWMLLGVIILITGE